MNSKRHFGPFSEASPKLAAICWLAMTFVCRAHLDSEHADGKFVRTDGAEVAIVRHFTDGIFFADPVSIRFRLPDGSEIARTKFSSEITIVRLATGELRLYHFETWLWPFAARVQRFDGYHLVDETSALLWWESPLVQMQQYWRLYGFALSLGVLIYGHWRSSRPAPNGGWFKKMQYIGRFFVSARFAVYVFLTSLLLPDSLLPILAGILLCVGIYAWTALLVEKCRGGKEAKLTK